MRQIHLTFITRAAVMMLLAVFTSAGIQAQTTTLVNGKVSYTSPNYITDVMIAIGKSNRDKYVTDYGWTAIDYDLNAGAGGAFVYLLYKTTNSTGSSGTPITDFYLKTGANPPTSLEYNRRTYYAAPGIGGTNLNYDTDGTKIYLFYTKDDFPFPNRAVTSITFDNNSANAVPENGGYDPCDLNNGAGGKYIYMHFTTDNNRETVVTTTTTYKDLDGNTQTVTATVLSGSYTTMTSGWYVVTGNVTNNNRINCSGSVNLILADGAKLTSIYGIGVTSGNNLTIWGQSGDTGELEVTNDGPGSAITLYSGIGGHGGYDDATRHSGTIIINGGVIKAHATCGAGIGGSQAGNGYVTINGGTVNAWGTSGGAGIGGGEIGGYGNVTINGGTVKAWSGEYASNIGGSGNADITINGGTVDCSSIGYGGVGNNATVSLNYTDYVSIHADSYRGTVTLKKDFRDTNNNYYSKGTANNSALAGKTLIPIDFVSLADNADNSTVLAGSANKVLNVVLDGRTLYRNGDWNTLCLPFSLNSISGTPLAGAEVKEIDNSETGTSLSDTGNLTLRFKDASKIEAGKPYILKWNITIGSTADWNTFASNVNNGTTYADKVVRLTADIDISRMVGTESHPFKGTFDGQGHTLNVNITDESNQGTAPFHYISGATIANVKITGTVNGTMHCAGLVGFAWSGTNTIKGCEVAATITCAGTHCGGILGHGKASATTITDCLFSGSVSGATEAIGVIYGWGDNPGIHTIVNCFANGTYNGGGIGILRKSAGGGTHNIINCYGNSEDLGGDVHLTTATGSDLVALLGSGWEVNSAGNAVPKIASTDIVSPVFYGVTINNSQPTEIESNDHKVKFVGQYSPFTINENNKEEILIISDNNIDYAAEIASLPYQLNSQRAHFWVQPDENGNAGAKSIFVDMGEWRTDNTTVNFADNADNSQTLNENNGKVCNVMLEERTLYIGGDWNTICLPFSLALKDSPLEGATVKTLSSADFSGGTLTLNFSDVSDRVLDAGKPYIAKWNTVLEIGSTEEWNTFASNVNSGTTYAGKVVRLTADIDNVSTMVGTENNPFKGIFDGQGHTLNLNISDTQNQGTAPFRYISNATIQNVKTMGTVSGVRHCAGLVGFAWSGKNTINNCEVAATITCNEKYCGGILGHGKSSITTITDCLFSGSVGGTSTEYLGIIYGWGDKSGVHTIVNCMANGTYSGSGINLLKKSGGTEKITNCYKNTDADGITQGTYTTATGSDLVALLGSGWEVNSDGNAVPKNISGIFEPVFFGVIINAAVPSDITSSDGRVTFTGTYNPLPIPAADNTKLFLGDDNKLYYPNAAMTIGALRAYFLATSILGDVNGDGVVSVTDVTMIVDYILGESNDNFIIENADMNGDGNISVSDVTALVNFILGDSSVIDVVVNGAEGITYGGFGIGQTRVSRK